MAVKVFQVGDVLPATTPQENTYLTFQSDSPFTLSVYAITKSWDGTLYYSTDLETWYEWNGTITLSSGVNNKLYLRGTGNTRITGSNSIYRWVLTGSNIECIGNIENLLDWETVVSGSHPPMAAYCYAHLFRGCTSLTSAPALPARTLAEDCYSYMFRDCTALASPPVLPARTLASWCYAYMFYGCAALTSAPALPATTLAGYCYYSMFQGCIALTSAPALPATTLANRCYYQMFCDCTALTSPPALPATTLSDYCYYSMFRGCTALVSPPALPATTLEYYCYSSMFYGCTSLTSAPALPATILPDYCYSYMFQGCTSLKISSARTGAYQYAWRIPTSGTGTTPYLSFWNASMFSGTGGPFTGDPGINTTYYVENPPVYYVENPPVSGFNITFEENGGTTIPDIEEATELPNPLPTPTKYGYTFRGWYYDSDFAYEALVGDSLTSDVTLYAKWQINTYTVTFYSNGGSSISPINNAIKLPNPLPIPTKENHSFLGWYYDSDFTNEAFADDPLTGNVTLYAKWELNTYTITYNSNGGSSIPQTSDAIQLPSPLPTPTKRGYKFVAWYYESNFQTRAKAGDTIEANTTLYAKWHNLRTLFIGIANAIRSKDRTSGNIRGLDFDDRIRAIEHAKEEETKTITPDFSSGNVVVTPTSDKVMTQVTINKDANLIADNIKSGVTIFGITGTYSGAPALTFQSDSPFTLSVYDNTKHWDGTLYYSTNGTTWNAWSGTTALSSVNNKLYLRGKGNTVITGNDQNYRWVLAGSNIKCIGNIENLLDWEIVTFGHHPSMGAYCYAHLFRYCTALVSPPDLPATTLADYCYYSMFRDCANLTSAPDLPATTLANNCYYYMFSGCTSLTSAPDLPATTLATSCYEYMFQGCTSLTSAPALLPATTLKEDCYYFMFYGCTSLTSAPALSATTLAEGCCYSMFRNCTALVSAPALLPATTLEDDCYYSMFQGCTSLTSAPALPATILATNCYLAMFKDCTALTSAPVLPATVLVEACYESMFQGCTSLTSAPALHATFLAEDCYRSMFRNCTRLTSAPALPATTLALNCYDSMFRGCTSLTSAPALPATILKEDCYYSMFRDCTALVSPPVLPATTMEYYCYNSMFQGCTSLKVSSTQTETYQYEWRIPASGTGTTYAGWNTNMLSGTGGTFTGNPDINTVYYVENPPVYYVENPLIPEPNTAYLTFQSNSPFTLNVYDNTRHWNGTLYYSTDLETWSVWDGTTTLSSVNNRLYLTGTGNTIITGRGSQDYRWVLTGSNIKCIGNIESLLDWETVESGNHPPMGPYCYACLFYDCVALTSAPALPMTTLDNGCYAYMFYGCTRLASPPALPATTLARNCYNSMFRNCTRLTSAPALPATTLAPYCYQSMFQGCTSLTSPPALPATTLKPYCYNDMFYECTSLTSAPDLPATTLANSCYQFMFSGCTSLTSVPALLPATTLARNCYFGMFEGCTALTSAPALPATTLASFCYEDMFRGCTSLISAPALPATTLANYCYYYMFYGCTSLTSAPALPATTLTECCYDNMFRNCTSLTSVPALPATTLAVSCYRYMFRGCTSLKISSTRTGAYQYAWRIPTSGTGTTATGWNTNMLSETGGTFVGNPSINTTYYVENPPVV